MIKVKAGYIVIAFVLTSIISLDSCKKDDAIKKPSLPVASTPADKSAIAPATSVALTWSATGGLDNKWDVYFGETASPVLYKADHNLKTISVPVVEGHTYYWKVSAVNDNGTKALSPVFSFQVKVVVNIDKFTGLFDCDEPRYTHYDVNLTKVAANTIEINNFWDLGWTIQYVFDEFGKVTIVPKTFNPSEKTTYAVSGSGTFDNATGKFVVDYTVLKNDLGTTVVSTVNDSNTHTFVKK